MRAFNWRDDNWPGRLTLSSNCDARCAIWLRELEAALTKSRLFDAPKCDCNRPLLEEPMLQRGSRED